MQGYLTNEADTTRHVYLKYMYRKIRWRDHTCGGGGGGGGGARFTLSELEELAKPDP